MEINQSLCSLSQISTVTTNRVRVMDTGFPPYPDLDEHRRKCSSQDGLADEATAVMSGNAVFALDHIAVIHVDGIDAESFLQGQISSDISKLTDDRSQLAAYSSPRGRGIAFFCLSRRSDSTELLMESHRDIADNVLKRLRMFILRAQARLEPSELCAIGLSGPDAPDIARAAGLLIPDAVDGVTWKEGLQVARRRGQIPRFSIRGPANRITDLWKELSTSATIAGSDAWRLLDILAGLPTIYPSTQDHFVAQMINMDLLGGISFDKGCYTGQEIVARLHYLGNLKRRMFLLHADADASDILPGTAITSGDSQETVGEVVEAAPSGQRQCALTAVLTLSSAESTTLRLKTNGLRLERSGTSAPDSL